MTPELRVLPNNISAMVFLLLLLVIQGAWRGVAPSPTDEGALRGGHGEHGEPGHQEPHKDSYSTFASEFLESRYLSDDGEEQCFVAQLLACSLMGNLSMYLFIVQMFSCSLCPL